jgi:hypothetical protein
VEGWQLAAARGGVADKGDIIEGEERDGADMWGPPPPGTHIGETVLQNRWMVKKQRFEVFDGQI